MRLRLVAPGILFAIGICPLVDAAPLVDSPAARETPDGIWLTLDESELGALPKRATRQNGYIRPLAYRALLLDDFLLSKTLDFAPLEDPERPMQSDNSDAILWLPMPDGTDVPFSFVEAPVMEPQLADKYPEIRTHLGAALDGSGRYVRFDRTPSGFHALIRRGDDVYIEPGEKDGAYLAYRASEYPALDRDFTCDFDNDGTRTDLVNDAKNLSFGGTLRTYRLAVACTGEYANFHGSTNATGNMDAMAAIATLVNRVTGIYEQELGVRLVLIGTNDQIVFTDPATDPFTGNLDTSILIDESQTVIQSTIGNANYDIGHTVSTGPGGLAGLGIVCKSNKKANGCTGLAMPTGDPFVVDFVCHEIGHQFGAEHTFNSTKGGCGGGNRNRATAFERGSGSTIMSYAGTCGSDNLQQHSTAYLHSISLEEISSFLASATNSCSTDSSTNNAPPIAIAGPDFTIPKNTPFTLVGQGSDPDADEVLYAWEEQDKGPGQSLTAPDNGKSPLFRCFSPSESKNRTFPRLANIVMGNNTLDELLPTQSRVMTFVMVARDEKGAFATDEAKITVASSAGPFRVTSLNSGVIVVEGGTKEKITWNVAGTNAAPINATNVRMLLSLDGGFTFPKVLKGSTPNDGKQKVRIPNKVTTMARVKVEAIGNVFWDMSDVDFEIEDKVFDIVGVWDSDEFGHKLSFTFREDGTVTFCDGPCEENTYTFNLSGPEGGELQLFDDNGDPIGNTESVEILDSNHIIVFRKAFTRL